MQSTQLYLGVPQTSKLPVYEVAIGKQATIKQMILTNTNADDAKVTVTVNTIDIMKDLIVKGGDTKIIDLTVVLKQEDRLSLQQEKPNAINAMINGEVEITPSPNPVPIQY